MQHSLYIGSAKPKHKPMTNGVLFFVVPPVGPAVPLSHSAYVEPKVFLTLAAIPDTISGVGPL